MYNAEKIMEKWAPLLDAEGVDPIKDAHRRSVTAVLLENQEKFLAEQSAFENGTSMLTEAAPTNSGNAVGGLVRSVAVKLPTLVLLQVSIQFLSV
ncbi:MAG: hypothetical protein CM15mV2_2820 [uncultured marine virus]|nr:MAG: hypothetical protein CM15mV2_2820 [uncultured marine virus]